MRETDMRSSVKQGTEKGSGGSSRFYQNLRCEYFPCHDTAREGFNCLFCYCPMYYAHCLGEAEYVRVGEGLVKDCSKCDFPHRPGNYETIVQYLLMMLHGGD